VAELHDRERESTRDVDELDDVIDFSLVHADDAFLDALGSAQPNRDG
jgi:hypothetical protein